MHSDTFYLEKLPRNGFDCSYAAMNIELVYFIIINDIMQRVYSKRHKYLPIVVCLITHNL